MVKFCLDIFLPRLLSDKNLPAAIEDVSGNQVPESIKEKSEQIRAQGGLDAIQRKIYELPELLDRNREIIREVSGVNGRGQHLVKVWGNLPHKLEKHGTSLSLCTWLYETHGLWIQWYCYNVGAQVVKLETEEKVHKTFLLHSLWTPTATMPSTLPIVSWW